MSERKIHKRKPKYKKAPQAPRRFKSAYMFFSIENHMLIRNKSIANGLSPKTTDIAKLVSQAWKSLPEQERSCWDELAQKDKDRFDAEKLVYSGPWKVLKSKRLQKDPSIPKRPMSAFLAYSQVMRAEEKRKNPEHTNTQLSRLLAQQWKDAHEDEKKVYIDQEYGLRQEYLVRIAAWRQTNEARIKTQRQCREGDAIKRITDRENVHDENNWNNRDGGYLYSGSQYSVNANSISWPVPADYSLNWHVPSQQNMQHHYYSGPWTAYQDQYSGGECYNAYPQGQFSSSSACYENQNQNYPIDDTFGQNEDPRTRMPYHQREKVDDEYSDGERYYKECEGHLPPQTSAYHYIRDTRISVHPSEQNNSDSIMEGVRYAANGSNHPCTAPYYGYYFPVSSEQMNERNHKH